MMASEDTVHCGAFAIDLGEKQCGIARGLQSAKFRIERLRAEGPSFQFGGQGVALATLTSSARDPG